MNPKLLIMAVAVVAAFGTFAATTFSPITIATPAVAQNTTGDNATMMSGNMSADKATGYNWTK